MTAATDSGSHAPRTPTARVWDELDKATFAILGYVTPAGEPRSSGVMYAAASRHLYLTVGPNSWKARQIHDGQEVAVTVPVRRGGVLSLLTPIPPATVSFHARATVHAAGSLDLAAVSKRLASLLPAGRDTATVIELVPEGAFLTYGIGVSLRTMRDPAAALAHVPVA
ncbi:MAG: pyridoxamine 5'-phosphate oxidase family protein [Chloroflexota bacterium]